MGGRWATLLKKNMVIEDPKERSPAMKCLNEGICLELWNGDYAYPAKPFISSSSSLAAETHANTAVDIERSPYSVAADDINFTMFDKIIAKDVQAGFSELMRQQEGQESHGQLKRERSSQTLSEQDCIGECPAKRVGVATASTETNNPPSNQKTRIANTL